MRQLVTIGLSFILTTNSLVAQPNFFHSTFEAEAFHQDSLNPLKLLIAADPNVSLDKYTQIEAEIGVLVADLQALRQKSTDEVAFLEKVFYKIHRKHLGWYQEYALFSHLFNKKTYDCVTGTAFFGIVLDRLGVPYQILEFDFHTLLLVEADGSLVMMEATDPLDGFVTDAEEQARRIVAYTESDYVDDRFAKTGINQKISLLQLTGLHYFNLAVNAFNQQDFESAIRNLEKAEKIYPSPRVVETKKLISSN